MAHTTLSGRSEARGTASTDERDGLRAGWFRAVNLFVDGGTIKKSMISLHLSSKPRAGTVGSEWVQLELSITDAELLLGQLTNAIRDAKKPGGAA
jgi:hypothetical protein